MGGCLSKGQSKDGNNVTIQPTRKRVGTSSVKQSRHKPAPVTSAADVKAQNPPKVDEPKHEQLPDPAGTPEKADPQETLQSPDQLQDIRVIHNGKVGDAADGHPDPVTVVPEELAAVKPGSVEINDLGIPAVSPASKGGLPGSEVSGIRPDLAAGETDSLLDASGRGEDSMSEETADKEPVPQPSPFTSLPQVAERGLLLHASQAPGSSTTEESISAPDSEADDEVTGMLRQDSYHSEQHEGSGLPDDSQYPESLILSAPQQFSSGRSTPRSELHDCITATCDAPLDTMWAQAFKLGDDVITVKGFTPREVQEAGLVFEDAPQPIVPCVAVPPSNMSDRDESLEASGKGASRHPGQDGGVVPLSELSATHAGKDSHPDGVPSVAAVEDFKPEEQLEMEVHKLEEGGADGVKGKTLGKSVALNAGDVAGTKPKDLLEVGPAEDPEASADHDGWTIAAKHAGQLEDTTAVAASATAAPAPVGHIHSPEPGDSTAHNAVSSATPEDLLPVKASPNESGGQDARPTAAKHTGDMEAESPLVASRIAASDGGNVPASHTSSNKSKTGDFGVAKADQVSGYKLKDLLATNPFEDFESSADEGVNGWATDVKPFNDGLEAPPAIVASVMVPASQAHGTEPGIFAHPIVGDATLVDASAHGKQGLGETCAPKGEVDLDTADGTNEGATDLPVPPHASEGKGLSSFIGDPLTPVKGREVLSEGDAEAGKNVAAAGETQGIAGVSPFKMPDLGVFNQGSSSDQGEYLGGDNAEGVLPSKDSSAAGAAAQKAVQQDTTIDTSQAALVGDRTSSEAVIDDALRATVTSVLWSSPCTIAEGDSEKSDASPLLPAQAGTAGAANAKSVDESYTPLFTSKEQETEGRPLSLIKGIQVMVEATAEDFDAADEKGALELVKSSEKLARPTLADAREIGVSDDRTASLIEGPPSPVDAIPVIYEAEAGTAESVDEEAALSALVASLTPAGPGVADADDVRCSGDRTALIEGTTPSPVMGMPLEFEAASDGSDVIHEDASVETLTTPPNSAGRSSAGPDDVESFEDSTASVQGGPTSPIKNLPVEFEASADHADVTGETAPVGPLLTSPNSAAPSRGGLARVGSLDDSAAAPEGELAMSEQDVESKGVMDTNHFDSPVDVAAAAALHCSPESANSTEMDVHYASELDHADSTEPDQTVVSMETETVQGLGNNRAVDARSDDVRDGYMSDSSDSNVSSGKPAELAAPNGTAAASSDMHQALGRSVSNVPSLDLSSISGVPLVQGNPTQGVGPTADAGTWNSLESGYESDSEGSVLTPIQPHILAAESRANTKGEAADGFASSYPADGEQGLEVTGGDLEDSNVLAISEVAMGASKVHEGGTPVVDEGTLAAQKHDDAHVVDDASGNVAGSLVSGSADHVGVSNTVLDQSAAVAGATNPLFESNDNVPANRHISADSDAGLPNIPLADIVQVVHPHGLEGSNTSVIPVYAIGRDELDDSLTTISDNAGLPTDMEKPAGFVDDASAEGGGTLSPREDHAGGLNTVPNTPASGVSGAEKPLDGFTDNLTATMDLSTAVHEPEAVPVGMLFNTVKDVAMERDLYAASERFGYESDSHEEEGTILEAPGVDTHVHLADLPQAADDQIQPLNRHEDSESGEALDSTAALFLHDTSSIGADPVAAASAKDLRHSGKMSIIAEEADVVEDKTADNTMATSDDVTGDGVLGKTVDPDAAAEGTLTDTFEVAQRPDVSSLKAHSFDTLDTPSVDEMASVTADKDAALDGLRPQGAAAYLPVFGAMSGASFDDGCTGSLPPLMEVETPAAAAVSYSGRALKSVNAPVLWETSLMEPEAFDQIPNGAGRPLFQLNTSIGLDSETAIVTPMPPAAEEGKGRQVILQAPAIEALVDSALKNDTSPVVESNDAVGLQGSALTVSLTQDGSDALAMRLDAFSPGEDGFAGLLGSALLGSEEDVVEVEIQPTGALATSPAHGAGAEIQNPAEGQVEEDAEADVTGGLASVGTALVDQAKDTVAWASTGVVDAVTAVANTAGVLSAQDSPARSDMVPDGTAADAEDLPVTSKEPSSMNAVRAAGTAIAEKLMTVAEAVQARVPVLGSAPGVTEEDGPEETLLTRDTGRTSLGSDGQGSKETTSFDAAGVGAGSQDVSTLAPRDVMAATGDQAAAGDPIDTSAATAFQNGVSTPPAPQASGAVPEGPLPDASPASSTASDLSSEDRAAVANVVQGIFRRVALDQVADVSSPLAKKGVVTTDADPLGSPALDQKAVPDSQLSPFMGDAAQGIGGGLATVKTVPGVARSKNDDGGILRAPVVTSSLVSEDDLVEPDPGQEAAPGAGSEVAEDHEDGAEVEERQQGPGIASRVLGLFGFGGLRRSRDASMDVRRSVTGRETEAEIPDMPLMQSASPRIIPTSRRHKDRMHPTLSSMMSVEFSDAVSLGLSRMNSVDTTTSFASYDILKSHPVEFDSDIDEA